MSKEMPEKESMLNSINEEELKEPETQKISDVELENITGGMTNEFGCTMTTIGYGCENWKPSQDTWAATSGHCGSCAWNTQAIEISAEQLYTICTYGCEFISGSWYKPH